MANVDRNLKVIYDFRDDCEDSLQVALKYDLLKLQLNNGRAENHSFHPAYAFPSDNHFYQFSALAYENYTDGLKKEDKIFLEDWYLLKVFEGSTGVHAMLYLNASARQLMLTFKGTSLNLPGDVKADLSLLMNKDSAHFDSASTIADEVRKTVEDLNGRVQLLITGHSLGGFLAQIATYIVKHKRIREEKFIEIAPTDVEIHAKAIVFDSPPCLDQIIACSKRNPIDLSHYHLDITTYIWENNVINNLGSRRPHLGTVMCCKPQTTRRPTKKEILIETVKNINPFKGHTLLHFSCVGRSYCDLIENIGELKIQKHDPSLVPRSAFSLCELKYLEVAPFVQFLESKSLNLNFNINEFRVKIFGEKADTFVPKLRILIREEKSRFESVPAKVYAFFQVAMQSMFKKIDDEFDNIDIELDQDILSNIEQTDDDIFIQHSGSWRDKILLARILQSSIVNFHYIDYNKFRTIDLKVRDAFLKYFDGTLALLIKDGGYHHYELKKKSRLLVISGKKVGKLTEVLKINHVCLSHLSVTGRKRLFEHETSFFGEKVKLTNLCKGVISDSTKWSSIRCIDVLDFCVHNDKEVKSDFHVDFHVPQKIRPVLRNNENSLVKYSMDEFISTEIKNEKKQQIRLLLSANPGMGKSTYLKVLRDVLQHKLAMEGYWVARIYLPDCSETLSKLKQNQKTYVDQTKNKTNSKRAKFDAMELFHKHALPEKCSALEKEVLINLLKRKRVFLLLDAFDEVCPKYRGLSRQLLSELKMQKYDFIVSTRPHEAHALMDRNELITNTFQLLEFDEASQKVFFTEFFKKKMNKKTALIKAEHLISKLKNTKVETNFWGVPLHTVLAAKLFENSKYSIKTFDNLASLYSEFLDDILSKDVEEKLGLNKYGAKSKFSETKNELKKCLMLAATQHILEIKVIEPKAMQNMLKKLKNDVNATGIANILRDENSRFNISFLSSHTSFAEFLAATYLVDQMKEKKYIQRLSEFLSESQFQSTRRFVNDILREMERPIGLIINKEMRGEIKNLESKIVQNLESEKLTKLCNILKPVFKVKTISGGTNTQRIVPRGRGPRISTN